MTTNEPKRMPLNASKHAEMVPFFVITNKGRRSPVSPLTARQWWDEVPESRGRIMFEDDAGIHAWDGKVAIK